MTQTTKPVLQEKLAKATCLFLAEMLRTREVSLRRAADIAARIVDQLDGIESENQFLKLIEELEFEFQEIEHLKRDIIFYQHFDARREMENLVREFVMNYLPDNPRHAVEIMEETLRERASLEELVKRFPDFATFIEQQHGRGRV